MLIDLNWSGSLLGKFPAGCDFKWIEREDALAADRCSECTVSLGDTWRELTRGETMVVDHFMTNDRCFMILAPAQLFGVLARPCPRKIALLEAILLEGNPKSVAIDLGLTLSSVATLTKQGLTSMGILCTPSRVPPQFVMAAFASKGMAQRNDARLSRLELFGSTFFVVSVARPDSELSAQLSPAAYTVARLFVEGKTHSEIARLRRTTTRTVANQLASVFQRLGVSGRLRLLGKLTTCAAPLSRPH